MRVWSYGCIINMKGEGICVWGKDGEKSVFPDT